jgi:hypothetical protein
MEGGIQISPMSVRFLAAVLALAAARPKHIYPSSFRVRYRPDDPP